MKASRLGFLLMAILCTVLGCANQDRLVIYSDPWLQDYAHRMVADFQTTHPETEIELKLISSEVIAQYVRFGAPMDVCLCLGCAEFQQADFRARIGAEQGLAGGQVVEVATTPARFAVKQAALQTVGCTLVEASDRPMRRYVQAAGWDPDPQNACTLVANFQAQASEYLLLGWVPQGFAPLHFARAHADVLRELRRGALIPNAFSAILLKDAAHPSLAAEFFKNCGSEKSFKMLAELKFLP